ncbi:MAG: hypothetical protein KAQ94_09595 [Arcobacteraceae bacterium]|nr:hypothetical protein [Arcobacteraceae bacterium]
MNTKIKGTLSKYRIFIKKETIQTKEMIITFKDLLHTQLGGNTNPTSQEIDEAIDQLKDVGKMAALLPLIAMPGSILTIPILIKLGKRYNIDILPNPK